jgi:hypothetical protein
MSSNNNSGPSLMVHNPVNMMITVSEALGRLTLDEEQIEYIISKREMWATFGKMNSHLYRAILMKRMKDAELPSECQFMIFFLFSVIKNRDRVLRAMDAMEPEDQAKSWFNPVKNFITTHVTQYVSDVVKSKKFPAVNIPNCNPGLDILVYCMITHPNERSLIEVTKRPTFSQLLLSFDVQAEAKEGYREYWDNIVTGSKNPDKATLEKPEFREEYYQNVLNDDYLLVGLDLQEIKPKDVKVGYTFAEIAEYFKTIDPNNEFVEEDAVFIKELQDETAPTPTE